jgi:hypothetical protein
MFDLLFAAAFDVFNLANKATRTLSKHVTRALDFDAKMARAASSIIRKLNETEKR